MNADNYTSPEDIAKDEVWLKLKVERNGTFQVERYDSRPNGTMLNYGYAIDGFWYNESYQQSRRTRPKRFRL